MTASKNKGYTLIELSIVLTIISLLIAAIAAGSSLVYQARLKSVITESSNFFNALGIFESKYKSLPGDMPNAYDVWGASCASNAANCNGNGDGHITWNAGYIIESLHAWQHLSLAGMINGSYTGIATNYGQSNIAVNTPASNFNKGGWNLNYIGTYAPPTYEGQYLELGTFVPNNMATNPVINPLDAYNLDLKVDDGYPRNGLLFGVTASPSATSCYTTNSITATYNTNLTTNVCSLRFVYKKY